MFQKNVAQMLTEITSFQKKKKLATGKFKKANRTTKC